MVHGKRTAMRWEMTSFCQQNKVSLVDASERAVDALATHRSASGVYGQPARRKHVLPDPFPRSVGVFPLQSWPQVDRYEALRQVVVVLRFDTHQVLL